MVKGSRNVGRGASGLLVTWSPDEAVLQSTETAQVLETVAFDGSSNDDNASSDRSNESSGERDVIHFMNSVERFAGEQGIHERQVILCVRSQVSYLVRIPRAAFDVEPTSDAVCFAVESELPLDAEAIEVDYRVSGEELICVAVETEPLESFLDTLESHGWKVRHVVPESFLVLQQAMVDQHITDTCRVIREDTDKMRSWVEILTIKDGCPVGWGRCSLRSEAMTQELFVQSGLVDAAIPCQWLRASEASADDGQDARSHFNADNRLADIPTEVVEFDWSLARATAGTQLLSGDRSPWFDLRRGSLAKHDPFRGIRGSLEMCLLAVTAAIIVICVSLVWKASRYSAANQNAIQSIRSSYKQAFPGQRVPLAVVKRVRSEHRKLTAQTAASENVSIPPDAIEVLVPLLAALPDDPEVILQSLRINSGEFGLDLDVASHDQAGVISRRLQEAGFEIEPPSTTRGSRGNIQTRLNGKVSEELKERKNGSVARPVSLSSPLGVTRNEP